MADFNIATGKEQPLNRTGIENVQVEGSDVQGTFVGVTTPSGETESGLYLADADPAYDIDGDGTADGPLKALGVLLPREIIPEEVDQYVTDHPWADVEEQIYREERTLSGDRAVFIKYGIEMTNDGADLGLTPGEPVYLDAGGGVTQDLTTLPAGAMVQKVGIALDPEQEDENNVGRERFLLDVEDDVQTVGYGDTITGDGATTSFTFEHNLGRVPSSYNVEPADANAASASYHVSNVDDTVIELTFGSAPTDGTTLTFDWFAEE